MKKFWNFIRNETDKRILILEGVIAAETWFGDEITPKEFRQELNSGEEDILVIINSEGGDIFAGTAIYSMLKEYSGHVTIRIESIAASAASVVAMAGDTVEISPIGMIFIHNPWTIKEGDSAEMRSTADLLDKVKETIIDAYKNKTNLSRAELSKMMDEETWIHAKDAVTFGFADKIIGAETRFDTGIEAKISSHRQIMNSLSKAFKAKREAEQKNKRVDITQRRERLNLY